MFVIKRLGVLCAAAALALAPAGAAAAVEAPAAPPIAAQPSQQDTQFLQTIHQVNLAEVAMGNLAQQNAGNQQVKDAGARFSADHTQLDKQVQQVASNLNVSLPNQPTAEQQATMTQLQGLTGNEFDSAWVTAELNGHMQAMQAVDTEIAQGSDPQVVQLAQTAQPVIQAHIDLLVSLAQGLGIAVPSISPRPGGTVTPAPGATTTTPAPGGTPTTPSPGGTSVTPSPGETGTETPEPAVS
ncbi:DUF4142 domain-containing protein [Polymorphospora rubra]|uniref:DUF4142 domain-containing protein n=1 Tax=Polymorphospora rubra TaxID=338584 RepID=A0A810N7A8_9ACTN|nr:DUF4142 domain-containing protein [Polymorphospora rubra]BCJ67668.1 hypothetical protein Prubr_46890 [Polymorphospora rubra]